MISVTCPNGVEDCSVLRALCVESFAAMQMHELYAGQPSVSELTKTVMSPAMQAEIRAYNKHTLDRKSRGVFDARSIDIDAEIKHANAMCPVTMHRRTRL